MLLRISYLDFRISSFAFADLIDPTVLSAAYNARTQHPELVAVKTFGNRPEADIAKGALASAGIDCDDSSGHSRRHAGTPRVVRDRFSFAGAEDDARAAFEVLTPANGASVNEGDGKSPIP